MKVFRIFRACALIAYALLLLIHFILKDHFQPLQIFFYAFPLPILIFIGCVITVFYYRSKAYFTFFIWLTIGLTGIWLNNAYVFPRAIEIPEDATSVIFWNAANRATLPMAILTENIKKIQPDIIALSETEHASEADIQQLAIAFPAYEFRILEGEMMLGVRGKIKNITYVLEEHSYDINFVEMQLHNGPLLLAFTDTFQSPTMDKRKTLETVLQLISERKSDLIVGDFNTPYESVHFRNFETDYTSFHEYAQGFTATWPFGIPLLEIDQIYTAKTLTPILLQKFYYKVSDHAMLVGYFK
ncbi:endonuclease/exonuclease/phosphatase family protein [Gelidibacter sp.]|uniref:endonuclease/exonuclease/phosphatase family protein n=1 Tax=Gelidibacter sp. TaxID=2018083 RepID=UPI002CE85FF7|nr:endonuclease/exonuclease/phosphatase family protein [Gelidibacter sp.]HUH28357.1 endonuclease/exonuclease/phosphatase family protein [Gelidibacter sp.]